MFQTTPEAPQNLKPRWSQGGRDGSKVDSKGVAKCFQGGSKVVPKWVLGGTLFGLLCQKAFVVSKWQDFSDLGVFLPFCY